MIIAPAIGIAACQVLGWLSLVVAALSGLLVAKQFVWPNDDLNVSSAGLNAAFFGAATIACFWGARMIRRAAQK